MCNLCNGKGGFEQKDFGDDSGNTSWDTCPRCDGTGEDLEN